MPILSTPPGAPKTATYVTISAEAALTADRTLTGTSNQIVITDNGANSTVVLSLPQSIDTGATVTFSKLTLSLAGVGLVVSQDATIAGYLRVGSGSAPSNTTAGDLTVVRLSVGNTGAFSGANGYFVQMTGTMTDTSGTNAFMFVNATGAPASNSTATFQGINFLMTVNASGTLTQATGGNFANIVLSTGAITTLQGFLGNAIQTTSSSGATVTVTTAQGVVSLPLARVSGTTTGTITTATGFDMNLGVVGNSTWTITSLYGLRIADLLGTSNTITTFSGIRVEKITKGTTNEYAAQIFMPGLQTGTGTMTDIYGYITPTATVSQGNQTATTTNATVMSLGIQTYTSTTNTRTITNAHTLYIEGAPVASTNVTFTNTAYALFVDAGPIRLDATTANGTTATVLGSVGPAGANTTVQEWLTITIGTNVRYIPCF